MGYHFRKQSDLDPFVIDHGRTVLFPGMSRQPALKQWLEEIAPTLISIGGIDMPLRGTTRDENEP